MSREPRDLGQLQQWMQAVLTHPSGITAGISSDDARTQINVTPEQVEQILNRSQSLTSLERLQIYGGAYYARLSECLQSEFPALLHALGEESFNSFAFSYLQEFPSRSYTLGELGKQFPEYLSHSRPPREVADEPDFADFLIDLARLERTYSDVFDGSGPEKQPRLTREQLEQIPPDRWPDARLIPFECVRLLTFSFPVHEYASAVRRGEENIPPPAAEPTRLAITRRDYVVRRVALDPLPFRLLTELVHGRTVGEAIATACALTEIQFDRLAADLQIWFRDWTAAPFFRRVEWDSV